jgi:hypothetical protein
MIWRIVSRYAQLRKRALVVDEMTAYAVFDGLFQQALLRHIGGAAGALDELQVRVRAMLPKLV